VEIEGPGWQRAVVFQEHGLFPWLTVAQNIEFGLKMKKVGRARRKTIVRDYVHMVGLDGFENKYPKELSGGMKQRVGIARALAVDSELIVMDEPLGSLDAQTRTEMQNELLRIWQQDRRTVVLVTHSIEEALKLGDTIAVMSAHPGRLRKLVRVGKRRPRNVLTDPDIIKLNVELHEMLFQEHTRHEAAPSEDGGAGLASVGAAMPQALTA
jgi:NitT/TauT family transport system ATP-binding protein